MPRDLITVAGVRARDAAGALSSYSDALVQQAISDISAIAEGPGIIGHAFPHYEDKTFTFLGDGSDTITLWGFPVPLAAAPDQVDEAAFDDEAFDLLPADGPPYEQLRYRDGFWEEGYRVKIQGDWGWADIPDDVAAAAFLCVRRYLLDESYAGEITGSGDTTDDIRGVTVGETSVSVQFGGATSASSITSTSIGIPAANRVFRSYRRDAGGAVV